MVHLMRFALVVAAAGSYATQIQAQAVVGNYSYTWTDTFGTPLTLVNIAQGSTITVQLRINESGGNLFTDSVGILSYDMRAVWSSSAIAIAKSNPNGAANATNSYVSTNPYPSFGSMGFAGPGNFNDTGSANATNSTTDAANTARAFFTTRSIDLINGDPPVTSSQAPNSAGSILIGQYRFVGVTAGTATLTGSQRPDADGNFYNDLGSGTSFDSAIGGASANLVVTVTPVPEPAVILAVATLGLAALRGTRRRRA